MFANITYLAIIVLVLLPKQVCPFVSAIPWLKWLCWIFRLSNSHLPYSLAIHGNSFGSSRRPPNDLYLDPFFTKCGSCCIEERLVDVNLSKMMQGQRSALINNFVKCAPPSTEEWGRGEKFIAVWMRIWLQRLSVYSRKSSQFLSMTDKLGVMKVLVDLGQIPTCHIQARRVGAQINCAIYMRQSCSVLGIIRKKFMCTIRLILWIKRSLKKVAEWMFQ